MAGYLLEVFASFEERKRIIPKFSVALFLV